jgi:hypothetical protein
VSDLKINFLQDLSLILFDLFDLHVYCYLKASVSATGPLKLSASNSSFCYSCVVYSNTLPSQQNCTRFLQMSKRKVRKKNKLPSILAVCDMFDGISV